MKNRCTRIISFKQFGVEEFEQCEHEAKFNVTYETVRGRTKTERVCGKHKFQMEKLANKNNMEIEVVSLSI